MPTETPPDIQYAGNARPPVLQNKCSSNAVCAHGRKRALRVTRCEASGETVIESQRLPIRFGALCNVCVCVVVVFALELKEKRSPKTCKTSKGLPVGHDAVSVRRTLCRPSDNCGEQSTTRKGSFGRAHSNTSSTCITAHQMYTPAPPHAEALAAVGSWTIRSARRNTHAKTRHLQGQSYRTKATNWIPKLPGWLAQRCRVMDGLWPMPSQLSILSQNKHAVNAHTSSTSLSTHLFAGGASGGLCDHACAAEPHSSNISMRVNQYLKHRDICLMPRNHQCHANADKLRGLLRLQVLQSPPGRLSRGVL